MYDDLQLRAFTQIAYIDLESKYNYYIANNSLVDHKVSLYDLLAEEEIEKFEKLNISKTELKNWKISGVYDANEENGFYACIIETSPGNAVIAFRGSEDPSKIGNAKNDWIDSDLKLLNSISTTQQKEVERFFANNQDLLQKYDNLTLTGHSLGGNLAEYGTIISEKYALDEKIKQCYSLDGPGFSDEFINKYRSQINKMSSKMCHYRWSLVGKILNDLPNVTYKQVGVSDDSNNLDDQKYNLFTRHDTKYLDIDMTTKSFKTVNGLNNQENEFDLQNLAALATSYFSKGVDHMPSIIGDAIVNIIESVWLSSYEIKRNMYDKNGDLTITGKLVICAFVMACAEIIIFPISAISIIVGVLAFCIVAVSFGFVYDMIVRLIDYICSEIKSVYNWGTEQLSQLRQGAIDFINRITNFYNNKFNIGYQYASANPQIKLDTYKLRDYAQRLDNVNKRAKDLDRRLKSLYGKIGLLDLFNLIKADILIGESWKISQCSAYLRETADDFDNAETEIIRNI